MSSILDTFAGSATTAITAHTTDSGHAYIDTNLGHSAGVLQLQGGGAVSAHPTLATDSYGAAMVNSTELPNVGYYVELEFNFQSDSTSDEVAILYNAGHGGVAATGVEFDEGVAPYTWSALSVTPVSGLPCILYPDFGRYGGGQPADAAGFGGIGSGGTDPLNGPVLATGVPHVLRVEVRSSGAGKPYRTLLILNGVTQTDSDTDWASFTGAAIITNPRVGFMIHSETEGKLNVTRFEAGALVFPSFWTGYVKTSEADA